MTPFRELCVGKPTLEQMIHIAQEHGINPEDVLEHYQTSLNDEVFINPEYLVIRRQAPPYMNTSAFKGLMWLIIRRRDGNPVRNWEDLQEIKNLLLGPQAEAIEIYPAESRRVNAVNQFHLFGAANMRAPFGFPERQKEEVAA